MSTNRKVSQKKKNAEENYCITEGTRDITPRKRPMCVKKNMRKNISVIMLKQ